MMAPTSTSFQNCLLKPRSRLVAKSLYCILKPHGGGCCYAILRKFQNLDKSSSVNVVLQDFLSLHFKPYGGGCCYAILLSIPNSQEIPHGVKYLLLIYIKVDESRYIALLLLSGPPNRNLSFLNIFFYRFWPVEKAFIN